MPVQNNGQPFRPALHQLTPENDEYKLLCALQCGEHDPDLFFTDRPRGGGLGQRNREYLVGLARGTRAVRAAARTAPLCACFFIPASLCMNVFADCWRRLLHRCMFCTVACISHLSEPNACAQRAWIAHQHAEVSGMPDAQGHAAMDAIRA